MRPLFPSRSTIGHPEVPTPPTRLAHRRVPRAPVSPKSLRAPVGTTDGPRCRCLVLCRARVQFAKGQRGWGGGSVRGRARNPKLAGGHANAAVLGCILLHSGVALGAVSDDDLELEC